MNNNINITDKDDSFFILLISSNNTLSELSLDELSRNGFNSAFVSLSDASRETIQGINPSIIILDLPIGFDVDSFFENTFFSIEHYSILLIFEELDEKIVQKYKLKCNVCVMQKPLPTEMLIKHLNFSRSLLYSYKLRIVENQNRFKDLVLNLNDIFFQIDLDGNFLFVSPATERLTGYVPDEIIGKHFSFLLHNSSHKDFNSCFPIIDKNGEYVTNQPVEVAVVGKNGNYLTMLSSVGKIIYKGNVPYCFSGILTDISNQKKIQRQLIGARDNYLAIVKSIPDLIFRHNIDGVIVDYQFNNTKELIVPPEKIIGTKLEDLPFLDEDITNIRESIKKAIQTGEVVSCRYTWKVDSIEKHYEARFSSVSEDEVFTIVRDITEQVNLLASLKDLENNYKVLVENTSVLIIRADTKLKPLFVNSYAKEFLELPDDVSCNNIAKVLFPGLLDTTDSCDSIYQDFLNNIKLLENIEVRLKKKNKDYIWISWVHTPIYDDNNNVKELLSIGADRTRLKIAEQNILDTANDIIRFQEAMSKIFVLYTTNIDDSIKKIIKLTADTLKVERIGYWELCGDEPFITCRYLFERTTDKFTDGYQIKKDSIQDYLNKLFHVRKLVVDDVLDFEPLSELKDYFIKQNIRSKVDTLIRISDKNVGIICIENVGYKRDWSLQEIDFMRSISDRISFEYEANERKLTLESKSIIEQRFKTFIEKTNDILISVDFKGIINYISPNVKNKLDYDVEYLLGQSIIELIHDDDYLEFYNFLKKLFSGENISSSYIKFRSRNRKGDWLWFQASATIHLSDANQSDYAIFYATEITSLVEAEITVRESKMILQSIFDTVYVGIMLLDSEGKIEHINKSGTNLFGYYTNEMINKHYSEFLPDYANSLGTNIFNKILSECKIANSETIIQTKSGESRYISIETDFLFRDNHTPWLVCVFSDITERKLIEEEIRRAKERAKIANKLKSGFLANVSHEIRTPLNSIIGFAHLVQELGVTEKQANYINSIKNSGKSLLTMVNDIIDLSKIESGKLIPMFANVNIYELLEKTFDAFKQAALDKNINLFLHIDSKTPLKIVTDESRFSKIVNHLLDNAIKYTDKGYVKFSLICNSINIEESIVDLSFKVEDTGQGISDDFLLSIYEPFAKQHSKILKQKEGFGTGLSLVKKLADTLNYQISIKSEIDFGTSVKIDLKQTKFEALLQATHNMEQENINKSLFPTAIINISNLKIYEKIIELLKIYNFDNYSSSNTDEMLDIAGKIIPDVAIVDSSFEIQLMKFILELKSRIKGINLPIISIGNNNSKDLIFYGCSINNLENEFYNAIKLYVPKYFEQKKTFKEVNKKEFLSVLNVIDKETLLELTEIFNSKIIPLWNSVSRSSILNELENFGNELLNFGTKYNLIMLSAYGNKLIKQTKDFDFDMLPVTLSEFELFIEAINEK